MSRWHKMSHSEQQLRIEAMSTLFRLFGFSITILVMFLLGIYGSTIYGCPDKDIEFSLIQTLIGPGFWISLITIFGYAPSLAEFWCRDVEKSADKLNA